MAFAHGKSGYLMVNAVDWSGYLDNISSNLGQDMADSTTFGKTFKGVTPGLRDAKLSCTGKFDTTFDGLVNGIIVAGASVVCIYGPTGNTTGMVKWTLTAFVGSYDITTPVADMVTVSTDLQNDGSATAPARTLWA